MDSGLLSPLEARRISVSQEPVVILLTPKLSSSLQTKTLALETPSPGATGIHLVTLEANHGPSAFRPGSLVMPLLAQSRLATISWTLGLLPIAMLKVSTIRLRIQMLICMLRMFQPLGLIHWIAFPWILDKLPSKCSCQHPITRRS